MIAKAGGFISANIHSSVSGMVNKIDKLLIVQVINKIPVSSMFPGMNGSILSTGILRLKEK